MALNQGTLVEMPAHCVRAKKNGAVYIQYTIRAYRNEKGKPTSERVSIGKEDPETGMLIPNRNYYEYVEKRKQIELPAFVRSCGTYSAHHENNCRLLNPPSKSQREIMQCLSLDPSSFGCV